MKDKIVNTIQNVSNKAYDFLDNKFNFPPTVDNISKTLIIPFGAGALGALLFNYLIGQ